MFVYEPVLVLRRIALWTIGLAFVGCIDLGLVCAFLNVDVMSPGSEILAGLLFGMFFGVFLSQVGQRSLMLPSPSVAKKFGAIFFAGLAMAFGFGLSQKLGAGLGDRVDRTITDCFLIGMVGGFWGVLFAIDSLPRFRTVTQPRLSIAICSFLGLGLAALLLRVPLNSTKAAANLTGAALCLPLGLYIGVAIARTSMPVLKTIATETKRPIRYARVLWRPLIAFLFVYGVLVIVFAAVYSTLYNHYGSGMFVFPSNEQGARLRFGDLAYFSIMTIATVGYGDIYPVHWAVRVVAASEVLVGFAWVVVYFALMMKYLEAELQRLNAGDG